MVEPEEADMAWLVYDLNYNPKNNRYELCQDEIIYTKFQPTMLKITTADPGNVTDFVGLLQSKLDEKLDNNPPDAPILSDPVLT